MGPMWVESASSCPQVLVHLLPLPSSPGRAPQEQFPGVTQRSRVHRQFSLLQPVLGQPHPLPAVQGASGRLWRLGGTWPYSKAPACCGSSLNLIAMIALQMILISGLLL